ncbi:MAG: hypothetical protein COV74_03895 [Candidatus Omnitrophica bacterium CG11_big_fil_rev_8_21_14_0_20_45_26]|uniref:Exosortase system-associated protein, TIGR04073 family n=1 Tax=Candidatus Abzuiibacterium crystallinum TaxID=1974748 RepID=A0A2H0LQJ1_9BACT|nr:MAG: hypothetical protein COV74_03895 [Candidatus Omnitrophica bacterium CG11_big_fil_rev_8_21_14_0_20_45_26]PIW65441.1 MAG: hypothetical protein COW12_01915 [Candidatus Omnitrophica bacterium CG12_big_fil_rev_8_21_14_0_65_45_16]
MKRTVISLSIILFVCSFSMPARADICTWAEADTWGVSAPGKLVRGVLNTALGWTNLFVQPFKGDGVMNGIGAGLSNFAVRTTQGIGEILLFWLPPVPEEPMQDCVFYDWGTMERQM